MHALQRDADEFDISLIFIVADPTLPLCFRRLCWDVIYATDTFKTFWAALRWMTEALHIFLLVLPSAGRISREDRPAWRELAQSWLMELADMIAFVVHATNSEDTDERIASERLLGDWLQIVLNKILPKLSAQGAGLYRLSLEPFLEQLNGLIVEMDDSMVQLNTPVVFRLSTMALSTPLKGESNSILTLFSYLLPSESPFARGLTSAVGSIFLQDDSCKVAAKHLLKTSQGVNQQLMGLSDRSNTSHVVQLLEEGDESSELLKFIVSIDVRELDNLSAPKQIETLLLGMSMMEIVNPEGLRDSARTFLKNLLRKYQHLGLLLMPGLISDINAAAVEKSPDELLGKLQFLAESVSVDPTCAQQAWNHLSKMLEPQNPVVVRVLILRLLPRLCMANKRLYRRIMDTLGAHRNGKTTAASGPDSLSPSSMHIQTAVLEVRIAVAASIADLAKDDLIRDTADCIGWIQEFLVEDYSDSAMNALLVHYAILALHYLVVAQELDFNLVLKVLKKKLCNVHNIEDVRHLPPVMQEALALLLGDGECKEESSSDEEDEGQEQKGDAPNISAQVIGSVQLLIDLGFQYENVAPDIDASMELIARIRRNINYSLSRYSLDALGLDEDGIKAAISWQEEEDDHKKPPELASRFISLRKLAIHGIQLPAGARGMVDDFDEVLTALNSKLLRFEEEALAAMLWKTKGTRHVQQRRGDQSKSVSKDNASLPAPSKLVNLHKKMPSTSSSIARLLCFEGKSLQKFLGLISEVSFSEERDPYAIVFLVQGFLNASSRLLGQFFDATKIKQIFDDVRRWGSQTGNSDAMYLTMTAISVYFPPRGDKNEQVILEQVSSDVWNAFKNLQFSNSDISKISLALSAVCALRMGSLERVTEIIGTLEQSVKGYGGQLSMGACYGLALIAQAISQISQIDRVAGGDIRQVKSKMGQIAGFLIEELLGCTETVDRSDVLTTLVACLQSGVSTPGLVGSLADSVSLQFSIFPSKSQTAKYLFISLGLCLPSLSEVNGDLLLGTLFLLERFQWGSGKGAALVPVLKESKFSGVLTDDEYNVIVAEYGRVFEQGVMGDEKMYGSEDIFYAVNGTSTKPSPLVVRQFLASNRFDDNLCISPLIGAIVSVCAFPCLGFGAKLFTASIQLRQDLPMAVVDSLLDVVSEALDTYADYTRADYSKYAVMLLGLLASIKNMPSDVGSVAPTQEKPLSNSAGSKLKSLHLDFALLPTAQPGTLLSQVMELIQQAHKGESSGQTSDMTRYMRCLEALSLPGHFAKHFLEPLISEENEWTKEGCISLLSAQINGRRKAMFDGRDFNNMALQISIMPLVSFNALLGGGKAALKFVTCLEGMVRSLPTELLENGTGNLWEVCLSLSTDETDLLVEFLKVLQKVLKLTGKAGQQNNVSAKTKDWFEFFVTTRVFADLRELSWGASMGENTAVEEGSIMKTYVACLTELPLACLEKFNVFTFREDDSFSGEVLRALVLLELAKSNYFAEGTTRAMREINKVFSWFAKKYIAPRAELYLETMRRMACALAAATKVLQAAERREILLSNLEQLLLCQHSAAVIGLDLLSVMLASWCSDVATDGDLSMAYICINSTDKLQSLSDAALGQLFAFFRHDLPSNLATYGRREKISAIIANQIWRLYSSWHKYGADDGVLRCLKKAYICGSSGETKDEDFVLLSSTLLLHADNSQSIQSLLQ